MSGFFGWFTGFGAVGVKDSGADSEEIDQKMEENSDDMDSGDVSTDESFEMVEDLEIQEVPEISSGDSESGEDEEEEEEDEEESEEEEETDNNELIAQLKNWFKNDIVDLQEKVFQTQYEEISAIIFEEWNPEEIPDIPRIVQRPIAHVMERFACVSVWKLRQKGK
ncbi:hypothetical protein B9Z55_027210 [Caenorhabditis nigoni]|uniref:Uncharacterized protein n=1 Tax=Caenorhabditis nigoni TaxID=1611254 RepID=A0A2G5SH90_9PELO|nr:hypothetical protein B9Z55_027210 [Caenorhabditis nigoni]